MRQSNYILMQKILILFVVASALSSCSSDDNNDNPGSVIEKVAFYRDSPNERQWHIKNGLLTNITLSNGTVVEEFTYDSQNRVVKDVQFTNSSASETTIITYNPDSTIKTINGLSCTFNASTQVYAYTDASNFNVNCQVNSNKLAVNYLRTGTNAIEYHMTYTNGNMTSYQKLNSSTADIVKNFQFEGSVIVNPIYNAILPVLKLKSLIDPNFFIDGQSSKSIATGYEVVNSAFHFNYGFISENNLLQIGIEVLDSNNNAVDFYSFADYYYQ